jgi:hypothetical protein
MAQEEFSKNADPQSLAKKIDSIAGGVAAGFKSARKELAEFIEQNRENYSSNTLIISAIDRIKKKDPQIALVAARIMIESAKPDSSFEDAAISKWISVADEIAQKDIFAAVNGEVMYAAVLTNPNRNFKARAIGQWELLFSRALHKDPVKAAAAAETAAEFAYQVRKPDVMPAGTTEKIIDVAQRAQQLAELRIIRDQLARREPGGPGLRP